MGLVPPHSSSILKFLSIQLLDDMYVLPIILSKPYHHGGFNTLHVERDLILCHINLDHGYGQ